MLSRDGFGGKRIKDKGMAGGSLTYIVRVRCKFNSRIIIHRNGTRKPSLLLPPSVLRSKSSTYRPATTNTHCPCLFPPQKQRKTMGDAFSRLIGMSVTHGSFGKGGTCKPLNFYFIIADF